MDNHDQLKKLLPKNNWFSKYLGLWPTVESPQSLLLFSAMSMFGATLGRRIWFDQDFIKIYPMLNLILVGPSGIGKSTAIGLAKNLLLKPVPPVYKPGIFLAKTMEKLHKELSAQPKSIIIASELANFFNKAKYNEQMIPYITELLDYGDVIERDTLSAGLVSITNPSATIIGGSTLEWLQEQLPDSAATGGFLARFLILKEDYKAQRVALPKLAIPPKDLEKLVIRREKVALDFVEIIKSAPMGSIDLADYEVADRFTYWYTNQPIESGFMAPFIERSRETVLRLCLLLTLAQRESKITMEILDSALALYNLATRQLRTCVVPMSSEGKLLSLILTTLGKNALTEQELLKSMDTIAPIQRLKPLILSHLETGTLKRRTDGKLVRTRS